MARGLGVESHGREGWRGTVKRDGWRNRGGRSGFLMFTLAFEIGTWILAKGERSVILPFAVCVRCLRRVIKYKL